MSGNSIGKIFRLTTFGESHGPAIGGIIEGCPAGLSIDVGSVQNQLDRRKPGQSKITTQRKEEDQVEFLSGIFENTSIGTPIGFVIRNKDHRSKDYDHIKDRFRPSHADRTYQQKYGVRDYRGGGRASARETACRVVAGAIASQILPEVSVKAYVSAVGDIDVDRSYRELDLSRIDDNIVRCPDHSTAEKMIHKIEEIRMAGDSLGGVVTCVIQGVPAGWGEPVFSKLHAELGKAMLSINAVKGFEIGSGFAGSRMQGSEHNDEFMSGGATRTNNSGGIQGGISNGEDIYFRVAFKPTATIMKDQSGIDASGNEVVVKGKGRHDPCVVPRAVPIVEAMSSLVLADSYLQSLSNKMKTDKEH